MAITDPPDHALPTQTDIDASADGVVAAGRAQRLRHFSNNRSDEARPVVFYSIINKRLMRAFPPVDEPIAIRWQTALKRLMPHSRSVALRAFVVFALAFAALSGWIVALQASDEALDGAAVMTLARASSHYRDATPPAPVATAGTDRVVAPDLGPAGLRLVEKRIVTFGAISRVSEFIYMNRANQPVVLLVGVALTAKEPTQWVARRVGNIRLLTWVTQHQRYLLAGDADTRGLMQAADIMTLR
jgi:hypothetical protein